MFWLPSEALFFTRTAIITYVTLMCVPFECVFDVIEDELNGRGHNLSAMTYYK